MKNILILINKINFFKLFFNINKQLKMVFISFLIENLTPIIFNTYITKHLEYKLTINRVIWPVLNAMRDNRIPKISGLFIKFSGRFTRKQRALHRRHIMRKTPFSMIITNLDYNFRKVKLKNSICGIKIYILRL